jgi:sugar phosphate isomerase/epimerase
LGINKQFGISGEDQIRLFYKTGFEAFFTGWDSDLPRYRQVADELGMIYQSVHAPFGKIEKIWMDDAEAAQNVVSELIECVNDCAENNVPIMICHVWKGFNTPDVPNDMGVANFEKVVRAAEKLGVKIAFENTEGEEFLEKIMSALGKYENVGFCFDSGHELCYNFSRDMLAKYGSRLIATHLNDNLGIKSFEGNTHWLDDLHLLPYDGVADWDKIAADLSSLGFSGPLTFELIKKSKPGRHDNDKYYKLPIEEYLAEAYARACRVATAFCRHN